MLHAQISTNLLHCIIYMLVSSPMFWPDLIDHLHRTVFDPNPHVYFLFIAYSCTVHTIHTQHLLCIMSYTQIFLIHFLLHLQVLITFDMILTVHRH